MTIGETIQTNDGSPAELVAIARAAHLAGDRSLKRVAIRELRSRFGITISFSKAEKKEIPTGKEAATT